MGPIKINLPMHVSKTSILAIIAILLIVLVFILRNGDEADIKKNGVLINVKITDILFPSKGAGSFNYRCSFIYGGEQKTLISPTSLKEHGRRYVDKLCPALYSPIKNNLRVLLGPEDFEEYNIPLTDSLIEVINRINN